MFEWFEIVTLIYECCIESVTKTVSKLLIKIHHEMLPLISPINHSAPFIPQTMIFQMEQQNQLI